MTENTLNIASFRLASQRISQNKFNNAQEAISWLGAIQGQDYFGAKWSIGLRLAQSTDREIEQALAEKRIIRTWLMRGTLHIVSAEDIRWMLQLLAPRIIKGMARRYRELELDESTLLRSNEILTKSLLDNKQMSRYDLLSILEQNGISTQGQRAPHLLQRAALDGLVGQTTTARNTANYILLDELKTSHQTLIRDEALAELALRYFTSRGPATLPDFVWWSGLTVADAKIGIELAKKQLVEEKIDGEVYWRTPLEIGLDNNSPHISLLPGFDEFLLGYKNRTVSLDPQYANRWCPGNNGMFLPILVVDGRVEGNWKRTIKKNKVQIEIYPFVPLKKNLNTSISIAAEQYSKFMEMPINEVIVK